MNFVYVYDMHATSRKSQKKSQPLVFCVPAEGVPLGIWYRRWGQKAKMMGQLGRERSLTIYLAVWIQSTNVPERQTDGHRTTAKTALTHSVAR